MAIGWKFRLGRRGAGEPELSADVPSPVVESGSFSHGFCPECGWQGPGRRARNMAAEDAQLHSLAGCGVDTGAGTRGVTADGTRTAGSSEGVPDRERLSARGRS